MGKILTSEDYLSKHKEWNLEISLLLELARATETQESIKWGAPTFTYKGKNIFGLGAFKSYVGIWFFQGGLLKDEEHRLHNAQDGKTKAMRQWRFQNVHEISNHKQHILAYMEEAIQNQNKGLSIQPKKKKEIVIPDELQSELNKNQALRTAFDALTTFKKREYADYISEAKREQTKANRLDKIIPMILQGIGLNDKYRNC